jgi:hypothetical protein
MQAVLYGIKKSSEFGVSYHESAPADSDGHNWQFFPSFTGDSVSWRAKGVVSPYIG